MKFRWIVGILIGAVITIAAVREVRSVIEARRSAREAARAPTREEISVTVIEGWTTRDIAADLNGRGIDVRPSDFYAERLVKDDALLREASFVNALPASSSVEGYLFPDTYRVWKDELPDGLLRKQLLEFARKTDGFEAEAQRQGRTLHDVVILASIIEKEARHDEDRPIIAGIFMNRLANGMLLQSDATLNYILQTGRSRLNQTELQNESLYNTYKYAGLPPGPIANPGMASLNAALHPATTSYFFFLTDDAGKTYYAKTFDEHVRNRVKAFGRE